MKSSNLISKEKKEKKEKNQIKTGYENIKADYFLEKIFIILIFIKNVFQCIK